MPTPKKGLATRATVSSDICHCGHRVDAHDSSENCRFRKKSGTANCGCTSVRTER